MGRDDVRVRPACWEGPVLRVGIGTQAPIREN
jgi:hypothetical protein